MKKIGIVTCGGDCPGLNAAISAMARGLFTIYGEKKIKILGIENGFLGFSQGTFIEIDREKLPGLSFIGGTILGTRRTPFKTIEGKNENGEDKISLMKSFYKEEKLDAVITLGGNGTHKTADLLSRGGLNIIALPKTIDNDIFGIDYSFGFHTAVGLATGVIEHVAVHAASHGRIMLIDIMGNKAGWIALYSGVAAEADIILIPEFPYSEKKLLSDVKGVLSSGKKSVVAVVAEGAFSISELSVKRKERDIRLREQGFQTPGQMLADMVEREVGCETRTVAPGHYLRGGSPNSFDRIYAAQLGTYAAGLFSQGVFGVSCGIKHGVISHNALSDIAGKTKFIKSDSRTLVSAKKLGVSFGS